MKHILIVDDREDNLYLLKVLLEGNGYTTDIARNGAEALEAANRRQPAVVVSDLLMPVMDGYTLLRHWRSDERLRGVPFIVYTATYTEPQDEELAVNLGADAFIRKPSDPMEFLAQLKSVESKPRAAAPPLEDAQQKAGSDLLELYSQTLVRKLEQRSTQLEQRDAEFRILTEVVPQIIWICQRDGRVTYLNPQWTAYTGLGADESSGYAWFEAFHPDDRQKVEQAWLQASDSASPYEMESRIRRSDGAYRWWLVRGAPFRDADQKVVKWFGTCTDVHDIKEAEVRIREQAALLDKATDAIFVCDLAQSITYWNHGAEDVFGWSSAEVLGRNLSEFLFREPAECHDAIQRTRSNGEWVGEIAQVTKGGKSLVIDARWSLVRDADGNPQCILAINTDITEKKALQAQFLRSQRMESVGRLTGGIAHDFNNLLTVVLSSAELIIARAGNDPQLKPLAEAALQAAERGADLTHRLLAFSRRQPLDPTPTELVSLFRGLDVLLNRTLAEDIQLEFRAEEGLWPALVDASQLENVILNLVINARDAMPDGGTITIDLSNVAMSGEQADEHEVAAGDYIRLEVSDTGFGMDPDTMTKAFEPFFTTKPPGQGSGLGLSMVHGFVKQSRGGIHIDSAPGNGTSITMLLPRARRDSAAN